ncbi:MAG: hypothetical protein EOM19_05305 [Candidatus Moranbacteria bacterium]|nr:hypothetical protein [Candidatus Moranbacteria bacterium]
MKVKIKDLKPNPFRDMRRYPIDENKVDMLRKSFLKTGFWDNIVGRKNSIGYEIAYGHHRLIALNKEFKKDFEIELQVKEISDPDMIRIMADENDEYYGASPSVINETVRVARDYLKEHPEEQPRPRAGTKNSTECQTIALFLGWKEHRIRESLEAIKDIDEGTIDKDTYERFKTQYQADAFRKTAKKVNLKPEEQKRVAKRIKDDKKGYRHFEQEMLKEKYGKKPKKQKDSIDISDFVSILAKDIESIELRLTDYIVVNFKYASGNSKTRLSNALKRLIKRMNELKTKNGGHEYEKLTSQ